MWLAVLVFAMVGVMILASVVRTDFRVDATVLVPLLLTGCGLLAVDVPNLRGGK